MSKQFEQGNIVQSGVGIDVAIKVRFFVVKSRENPNEIYYTRAGNLVQAKDGFLVTQDDYKIQGLTPQQKIVYSTDSKSNIFKDKFTSNVGSYNINIGNSNVHNINAKVTNYKSSAIDDMDYKYEFDDEGVIIGIIDKLETKFLVKNHKLAQTKIKDVELLINHYQKTLAKLEGNSEVKSQKRKISEID